MSYSPILGHPKPQFLDDDGVPLSGGVVYVYAAGTTDAIDSYTTSAGDTANANPIVLNARGEPTSGIYGLNDTAYKINLEDANNVQITNWPIDNLYPGAQAGQYQPSYVAAYSDADTFTIAGTDVTTIFHAGLRIKLTGGSDRYATVTSSSFSTDTTVNVQDVTDGSTPAVKADLHASMDTAFPATEPNNLHSIPYGTGWRISEQINITGAGTIASDIVIKPGGHLNITAATTLSGDISVEPGGLITVDAATTISGAIAAGQYQIFAGGTNPTLSTQQTGYPEWFGADRTGATDSAAAISNATSVLNHVIFTGTYLMDTAVVCSTPIHLEGVEGHRITPSLGLGGGKVFAFETDDVLVENLEINADGETFTTATGNTYALFGGDGATKFYNHRYINNKILNMSFSDGITGTGNLLVSHGIYVDNVDDVEIVSNTIDTISGACIFVRDAENFTIEHNHFEAFRWYTVQIVEGCKHWKVHKNQFLSTTAEGAYWGGAINTVSDAGLTKNKHGVISHNYFSGAYSYGGVIRLQSSDYVIVEHNELENLSVGTASTGSDELTGIRCVTRGVSAASRNDPCNHIVIRNNILHGPTALDKQQGIYISNEWWATRTIGIDFKVYGNAILSPDTTNYWEAGIVFHGFNGGLENIWVEDNIVQTYAQASPTVGGAIGFVGTSADGLVDKIYVGGNDILDRGTPASSYQTGIATNAYCDNVINTKPNYIENFFYGVRTLTNSGPTLEKLDDQVFTSCTTDEVYGVTLSYYGRDLIASTTYDPPSLADGASTSTNVSVTGAGLGDYAVASFSNDTSEIVLDAAVRVADSVRVTLVNHSGGVLDLASGTLRVRVFRVV